jgi:hypothetical protein
MNDAPERIWAARGLYTAHLDNRWPTPVEYVRADCIEALTAKLAKAVEALREAVYLLDPDEEDIAKETGLYRIVTTLEEIEEAKT